MQACRATEHARDPPIIPDQAPAEIICLRRYLDLGMNENILGTNSAPLATKADITVRDDPLQVLDLHTGIALACLRRTTVRSFAGCGRSRRRDLHLIPEMAEEIAGSLSNVLLFNRDGMPVIRSRIMRHICDALGDVPDVMARHWAGPDACARESARHEIARKITQRLSQRYTLTRRMRPGIVPAANVWCGLKDSEVDRPE